MNYQHTTRGALAWISPASVEGSTPTWTEGTPSFTDSSCSSAEGFYSHHSLLLYFSSMFLFYFWFKLYLSVFRCSLAHVIFLTLTVAKYFFTELSSVSPPPDGAASSSALANHESLDYHHKRGIGKNVNTVEIKMVSPYYCMSLSN